MKTKLIVLMSIIAMSVSLSLSAQDKKKNEKQKALFDVSMTCEKCKKRIEKNISFEKGVTDLLVDLPAKTVLVEYQENKTDTTKLRKAFEKLGYTATAHAESRK